MELTDRTTTYAKQMLSNCLDSGLSRDNIAVARTPLTTGGRSYLLFARSAALVRSYRQGVTAGAFNCYSVRPLMWFLVWLKFFMIAMAVFGGMVGACLGVFYFGQWLERKFCLRIPGLILSLWLFYALYFSVLWTCQELLAQTPASALSLSRR